jgi:hypothetical protein
MQNSIHTTIDNKTVIIAKRHVNLAKSSKYNFTDIKGVEQTGTYSSKPTWFSTNYPFTQKFDGVRIPPELVITSSQVYEPGYFLASASENGEYTLLGNPERWANGENVIIDEDMLRKSLGGEVTNTSIEVPSHRDVFYNSIFPIVRVERPLSFIQLVAVIDPTNITNYLSDDNPGNASLISYRLLRGMHIQTDSTVVHEVSDYSIPTIPALFDYPLTNIDFDIQAAQTRFFTIDSAETYSTAHTVHLSIRGDISGPYEGTFYGLDLIDQGILAVKLEGEEGYGHVDAGKVGNPSDATDFFVNIAYYCTEHFGPHPRTDGCAYTGPDPTQYDLINKHTHDSPDGDMVGIRFDYPLYISKQDGLSFIRVPTKSVDTLGANVGLGYSLQSPDVTRASQAYLPYVLNVAKQTTDYTTASQLLFGLPESEQFACSVPTSAYTGSGPMISDWADSIPIKTDPAGGTYTIDARFVAQRIVDSTTYKFSSTVALPDSDTVLSYSGNPSQYISVTTSGINALPGTDFNAGDEYEYMSFTGAKVAVYYYPEMSRCVLLCQGTNTTFFVNAGPVAPDLSSSDVTSIMKSITLAHIPGDTAFLTTYAIGDGTSIDGNDIDEFVPMYAYSSQRQVNLYPGIVLPVSPYGDPDESDLSVISHTQYPELFCEEVSKIFEGVTFLPNGDDSTLMYLDETVVGRVNVICDLTNSDVCTMHFTTVTNAKLEYQSIGAKEGSDTTLLQQTYSGVKGKYVSTSSEFTKYPTVVEPTPVVTVEHFIPGYTHLRQVASEGIDRIYVFSRKQWRYGSQRMKIHRQSRKVFLGAQSLYCGSVPVNVLLNDKVSITRMRNADMIGWCRHILDFQQVTDVLQLRSTGR